MRLLALLPALLVALPALCAPVRAESQVPTGLAVSQDPLVEQIRRRQLTEPNGGVTAAVRLGDGKVLPLQLSSLDMPAGYGQAPVSGSPEAKGALAPLKVHPGLLPKAGPREKAGGKDIKSASQQLKRIRAKSWNESRGHRSAL